MVSKLADLIQRYYPGLSRSEAFNVIIEVRKLNRGKLVGLKMDKFLKLMRSVMEKENTGNEKQKHVKLNQADKDKLACTCPFCFQIFVEKFSKERHIRIVHQHQSEGVTETNISETSEMCNQCNKVFHYKSSLKRHIRIHDNEQKVFSCKNCDKTFTRKDSMFKHRERVHKLFNYNFDAITTDSSGNFACTMCKAGFQKNIEAFKTHLSTKVCMREDDNLAVDEEGKFKCYHCDKSFADISSLNRHISVKHKKSEEFQCHLCKKIFSYKSTLKKHMKKSHS